MLLNEEGEWKKSAVQDLAPKHWAQWFKARLAGQDPFFSYGRDEQGSGTSNLFRRLFQELSDLDTTKAARGLCWYLRSLTEDLPDIPGARLRQALDLVMRVRARELTEGESPPRDELRALLRDWIQNEYILEGREEGEDPISPVVLHRRALFALVVLQRPGDERDHDIWEQWFEYPQFASAAFSGMALSASDHPPHGWLRQLLEYKEAIEAEGGNMILQYPLETLFMDERDPKKAERYLWREVNEFDNPEEEWERIRTLLDRVDFLHSYPVLRARPNGFSDEVDNGFAETEGPSSLWRDELVSKAA